MPPYRRTQTGYLILGVVGAVLVAVGAGVPSGTNSTRWTVAAAVLVAAGVGFGRLTVEVRDGALQVSFTLGWPRWRWSLHEIASAREVRNSWLAGWGLHWVPGFPGYWVINVSGFAAVELRLRNGRRYRVGTDDPDGLLAVLRQGGVSTADL